MRYKPRCNLRARAHPKLLADVLQMAIDCAFRNEEFVGDLAIGEALCYEGGHLALAAREARSIAGSASCRHTFSPRRVLQNRGSLRAERAMLEAGDIKVPQKMGTDAGTLPVGRQRPSY